MTRLVWLGAAVAAIFIVSQAHAMPLGTLIDTDGTITAGDKHFTNFQLHDVTGQNSTPADPQESPDRRIHESAGRAWPPALTVFRQSSECRVQRGLHLLARIRRDRH